MSAPQQQTPKTARRSAKKHNGQNSRMVVSENEAYNPSIIPALPAEAKGRQRRKSHANKKPIANPDAGTHSDSQTQRSTSSHVKTHATPIKQQAYAGPTFHQSPAASSLPMPSFYSKSLPAVAMPKAESESDSRPGTRDDVPAIPSLPAETKRESTPLDFLFEAARKAQTPGAESPHRSYLSAAGTPLARSPGPKAADSEFPFEMDSIDRTPGENGSAFSTPYKDRIEAIKTARSTSEGGKNLDDAERVAKTAALKKFLLNSAQITGNPSDNPFNARPAPPQPVRNHSSPSTPMHHVYETHNSGQHYFSPMQFMPSGPMSPGQRPPSSNLRNIYAPNANSMPAELSSDEASKQPRISTARDQTPARPTYTDKYLTPPQKPRDQRSTPSAQQLEDDLRRVLKLDLGARG